MGLRLLRATLFLVASSMASASAASTLLFDFETGIQDWALNGVFRTETDALGDSFAMRGFDGSSMSIDLDLTDIDAMVMDVLFMGSEPRNAGSFVFVRVRPFEDGGLGFFKLIGAGTSVIAEPGDPVRNPDRRLFDLSTSFGPHRVSLHWNRFACPPENPFPCLVISFPGLVDNIHFAVPEPKRSVWVIAIVLFVTRNILKGRGSTVDRVFQRA